MKPAAYLLHIFGHSGSPLQGELITVELQFDENIGNSDYETYFCVTPLLKMI